MPVRRDTDGKIVDEPTRRVRPSAPADSAADSRPAVDITGQAGPRSVGATAPVAGLPGAGGRYDLPTTPAGDELRQVDADAAERTRLIRPRRDQTEHDAAASDPMDDPPVGWLVVVEGPGKGAVTTLGMGVNTIGRDQSERVSLDFGDTMISRTNHGTVTYDPRGRKFYLQHGGGKNLTYVDDEPVLTPRELAPFTQVQMGATVLRFVPLCGAEFSWDDDDSTSGD